MPRRVVGPFDFTGEAAVNDQGYDVDPAVVSTYGIRRLPAGPFDEVQQTIDWYTNDNELTWQGTLFDDTFFGGSDSGRTPVDLSAVGDNAHGLIVTGLADQSGAPITLSLVVMWQGQALDLASAQSSGSAAIQPSDVQKLAQAMANHLNAGLAG